MTTATAPAVEKRKKPWTKARVIDLIIDIFCFVIVGAASLTCILPFIHILAMSFLSVHVSVCPNHQNAGYRCVYSNRYVSYGLCLLCADPPGIPWPQGVHLYDHVHDVLYRRYDP